MSNSQLFINSCQVPEGYKKTEVGVIPEDWEVKTIGDIGSVSSGGTPSRTNPLYWDGSIPWITTTQIDFNVIDDAEQFITQDGLNNSATKLFPPGTLLMAMYGQGKTRGKVAILGIKASINQACAAISFNEKIDHDYAFHYLVSQYEAIRNLSNIGNQENLNGLIIKSIKIPIPPFPEQKAIAQTLSDVDALIATLDKLITKKRVIKTGTMQQLLAGKKRLPGFGKGKGYKNTEIGVIPEDWNVIRIGEDALTYSGGTPSTNNPDYYSGQIPWITSGDLNKRYISEVQGKISENGLRSSAAKMIAANTLLIALYGATAGVSAISTIEAAINQAILAIIPKKFHTKYLFYYLEKEKNRIIETYTQGGQPNLSGEIIRSLPISAPNPEEQQAIAQVLSDMDAEIAALETRRAKTQAIKQGMMQELLTGKTRLI